MSANTPTFIETSVVKTAVVETTFAVITRLSDHIVMVKAKPDTHLTVEKIAEIHAHAGELVPGHYGLLIERHPYYSIDIVPTFQFLNSLERLKAIAIVAATPSAEAVASIDKLLFLRPMAIFPTVSDASVWLETQLHTSPS